MRIHELAKELNVKSSDILNILNVLGIEGKTSSSGLEDDQVTKIRDIFRKKEEARGKKAEKKQAKTEEKKQPVALTLQPAKADAPRVEEKAASTPAKSAAPRVEMRTEAQAADAPKPALPRGAIVAGTIISKAKAQTPVVEQAPVETPQAAAPAAPAAPVTPPAAAAAPQAISPVEGAPAKAKPGVPPVPMAKPGTPGAPAMIKPGTPVARPQGEAPKVPGMRPPDGMAKGQGMVLRPPVGPGGRLPVQTGMKPPGAPVKPGMPMKQAAPPARLPAAKPAFDGVLRAPGAPPMKVPVPPSQPPPQRPPISKAPPPSRPHYHGHRPGPHPGRRAEPQREEPRKVEAKPQPVAKKVLLPPFITVGELSAKLHIPAKDIITLMMKQGVMVTLNQTLTYEKSAQIASDFGFIVEEDIEQEEMEAPIEEDDRVAPRPPVVTVLGHVDHGKTSLLDAIRKTNVTAEEAGGITQRIGASTIDYQGKKIVFLDTPGHEAFTAMRARGAQVTDLAILVVAADDGVMPQTQEAVNHVKAAKVPILVAINKVDKPQANPERVKQQLADLDLLAEDWGGETICISVSAKQKLGMEELLEMIILMADMQELKANPHRKATGIIIEARLDKGLGPVATVLVQNGTLRVGDAVLAGSADGKVRAMISDKGERLRDAGPSIPVEIIGLTSVPQAGDLLQVVEDEKMARVIAETRKQKNRDEKMHVVQRTTLDDLFKQMEVGEVKDLNIIIKADSQGSTEALKHALTRLSTSDVRINVIHGGVGTITESDILLATASNAIVIGFNIRPDPSVKKLAEQDNVDIRLYRVIYHVIEDVKAALIGMLEPEYEEVLLGRAEVRAIFKISKVGVIAGCYVTDGKITRDGDVRLLRDSVVVYEGKLNSLKRFKEDVREVVAGFECGLGIEKFAGLQEGDIIEVYKQQIVAKELAGERT